MTQDDVFNIFHYFSPWQLALLCAALVVVTFLIALTKVSGLALIAPVLLFVNPMYNVWPVVFACVLLGVYFAGWYIGTKRREKAAAEKRAAADAARIAAREAENAKNGLDNDT